jgi:hypothetical protein
MKSTWRLIWILIGFVVLAGVDRVPDPPSAKPDAVQFSILSPHELPVAFGTTSDFRIISFWRPERPAAFVPSAFGLPTTRIEPLEQAADPSPPALHS